MDNKTQDLYNRLQYLMGEAELTFPLIADKTLLGQTKASFIGKDGTYTELLKTLGSLPSSDRVEAGRRLNEAYQRTEALFVTHAEGDRIITDYHEVWYARKPWKRSNPHLISPLMDYSKKLETVERLDIEAVADWICAVCQRYNITAGLFDKWNGRLFEQALRNKGLGQFQNEFFTLGKRDLMFRAVQDLIFARKLELYDWPFSTEVGEHSPLIKEVMSLCAYPQKGDRIYVAAPRNKPTHNDVSEALVRAVWLSLGK